MAVPAKDKMYVFIQILVFLAWLPEFEALQFKLPENLRWIALISAGIGLLLILFAFLQLNTNLSPFPSPKQGAKLVTSGVFAFARHPIYSGILFMAFGLSIWFSSGYKLIISFLLFLVFYLKSRYEEERLVHRFPKYVIYRRETGRFFPKFKWRI